MRLKVRLPGGGVVGGARFAFDFHGRATALYGPREAFQPGLWVPTEAPDYEVVWVSEEGARVPQPDAIVVQRRMPRHRQETVPETASLEDLLRAISETPSAGSVEVRSPTLANPGLWWVTVEFTDGTGRALSSSGGSAREAAWSAWCSLSGELPMPATLD